MKATPQNLKRFQDDRALVSIRREQYDDRNIQAFVIGFSDTLILLQFIYDFHVDGRFILRVADITDVDTTATEELQKRMLIEEGDFAKIDFSPYEPISSFDAFLLSRPKDEVVILEDEAAENPEFIMGTLISVDERVACIRSITGGANWEEEPSEIGIGRITSCQTGTKYINYYARHLSRSGAF